MGGSPCDKQFHGAMYIFHTSFSLVHHICINKYNSQTEVAEPMLEGGHVKEVVVELLILLTFDVLII